MLNKISCIVLLAIIAFFVISYRFNAIPKNLAYDELEFAKLALSLDKQPYTPYSPLATGHSTLYFYIILLSFKLFGVSNFALRLPSALFGIASVLVFYLILKGISRRWSNETMKQFLPLFLSVVFLTSRWYFNFARFAFEPTFLLLLELSAIYFLLDYLKGQKRSASLVFSGLFSGLAFNSYTPGRIFFLLPLFFLFLKLADKLTSKPAKSMKIRLLLFLLPFIVTITPLSIYLLTHKDTRIDQQFFLRNSELSFSKKIEFLADNMTSTALMFNVKGDINGRHNYPNKPALNPILGSLFLIGLAVALKNRKDRYNMFFLLYLLLSLIPTLMTYPWENPNMLRTFTVIPAIVYFVGRSIVYIASKKPFKNTLTILFLLLSLSLLYELRTYFKYQALVFPKAFEIVGDVKTLTNHE